MTVNPSEITRVVCPLSEAVRKVGQAPYILYKVEFQHTTFGSQSLFPDSLSASSRLEIE